MAPLKYNTHLLGNIRNNMGQPDNTVSHARVGIQYFELINHFLECTCLLE